MTSLLLFLTAHPALAGVSLLQIPKRIDATAPLTLTLLISNDGDEDVLKIPANLVIAVSGDMIPPIQLRLRKEKDAPAEFRLHQGEFRKVSFSGEIPPTLRGVVRIEPVGMDAAPMLASLVRPNPAYGPLPAPAPIDLALLDNAGDKDATIATNSSPSPVGSATTTADMDLSYLRRLSAHDPMYFVGGSNGGRNAKFQLSFKYRLFQPDDPRSRTLLDNLYISYTQFSLWDLHSQSAPFRDTNYHPAVFYDLPDLGVSYGPLTRLSFRAGLEHESNGRDGADSRSMNDAFIQPSITFGKLNDYHLTVQPKLYAYVGPTSDNPDIAQYRGHMDLRILLQQPNGFGLATTLRKGSKSSTGSIETQFTYPMAELIPGTAGYLMASYFSGYGESLLTYNQKQTSQFRIGYALSR
ncbi:phospholipase A [Herbaspirillum sp. RTI4]|uniref:phospholipase A n=1 Tax=Herbaspirillum sp. RTI4 TaxID=3048640 RepID=UPI002AB581B5|nr:phospholipase A [Herbaspirillum sp. RTI4]MDY7578022.1 phospholipase A [Herbaspirillum sp. RTI4]